jgi:hypothetical protein
MRQLKRIDAEMDALINERAALRAAEPSLAHLKLESRLNALHEAACNFDMDRPRLNTALRALFTSIEVDYMRHALRLTWGHGGKTAIRLNPDVMSIKDGWTATPVVEALRRLHPRRPRRLPDPSPQQIKISFAELYDKKTTIPGSK